MGGVLISASAFFALLGFPLDDLWHRLFGQDVTLWGPTHLMLIGGASLTLVGQAVLLVEGVRARPASMRDSEPAFIVRLRRIALMGGFLIGLSTFQAEFDFGVPQFQMIFQPVLIALAAVRRPGLRPALGRSRRRAGCGGLLRRRARHRQHSRRAGVRGDHPQPAPLCWPRPPAWSWRR